MNSKFQSISFLLGTERLGLILLLFLCARTVLVPSAHGADAAFGFASSLGGSSSGSGKGIAVDPSGNVYTTGIFYGTVDFDPGVGVHDLTSAGNRDIFVQKLNSDGEFVWAASFGNTTNDWGMAIAVDDSGNVYVTGSFEYTVDFDPGPGVYNITSLRGDLFVLKLDTDGEFIWAKSAGTSGGLQDGNGIAVDNSGNVYVVGQFGGPMDFDPGPGVFNLPSSGEDIFVWKLDSNGDFLWAKGMGGTSSDEATGVALDVSGNVYVTGTFWGPADFDPNAGVTVLPGEGVWDIFMLKLTSDGDFTWAEGIGRNGTDRATGIAVDSMGAAYCTGYFADTVDFDPGPGTSNLTSNGNFDFFVVKLDTFGDFEWARSAGADNADYANGIAVDSADNVYTIGEFSRPLDFNPDSAVYEMTPAGSVDEFIWKLNTNGDFVWAKSMGSAFQDYCFGVAIDNNDHVYTTGDYESTADFDPGLGVQNLTSVSNDDIFISKLSNTPTKAAAIFRAKSEFTRATLVDFDVLFGAPVSGLDVSDFLIDASGVTGAFVTNVTGDADAYTVTVNTGVGDGSVSIDLADDESIFDYDNDPLGGIGAGNGDYTTGESYSIDKTPPVISIGSPSQADTNGGPVTFNVSYSGASSINLSWGDITLRSSGTANATIGITNGATITPTVTLSDITGEGSLGVAIGPGSSADSVGNQDIGAGPSATFNVDKTAPTLSIGSPSVTDTNGGPVSYVVTYSGADDINLTAADVMLNSPTTAAAATISISNGGTSTPTVILSGLTGEGLLGIEIEAGTSSDHAGNEDGGSDASAQFNVDNTPPTISVGAPSLASTVHGPVSFVITYGGATSINLAADHITLLGSSAASVEIAADSSTTRIITLSDIKGTGMLGIAIPPGTSSDDAGNIDAGIGSSAFVVVGRLPNGLPLDGEWFEVLLACCLLLAFFISHRRRMGG
jgi:hypothetical protein